MNRDKKNVFTIKRMRKKETKIDYGIDMWQSKDTSLIYGRLLFIVSRFMIYGALLKMFGILIQRVQSSVSWK